MLMQRDKSDIQMMATIIDRFTCLDLRQIQNGVEYDVVVAFLLKGEKWFVTFVFFLRLCAWCTKFDQQIFD